MKYIFSPSKGMISIKKMELHNELYVLSKETKKIIEALTSKSKNELGTILKIKGELLNQVFDIYKNYFLYSEKEAILMYNGVSFKELDKKI